MLEIPLSAVAVTAIGYHAVLVMRQKLSYFHTVRYLLLFSYVLFGGVVASELGIAHASDVATASLLLKTEISLVIIATVLLGIVANVLVLQAGGQEFPYRVIAKKPSLSLVFNFVVGAATFTLVWYIFEFEFGAGNKAILETPTFIPHLDIFQITTLTLVLVGFVWNQCKIIFKDSLASQPASLFRVIRRTGLLWISMATILFTFNGALRTMGIDMVEFGHLLDAIVLTYAAYIYAKPTALLEFFASNSPLAIQLKQKQFSKAFNPFSSRLGLLHKELQGKRLYLFAELRQNLESTVGDFVDEAATNSHHAIVVHHMAQSTSTISRRGVSTIVLSLEAKNPIVGEAQMVVPFNRQDIVLSLVRKTLNMKHDVWVVFPNLSALIAHWGFASSYNFLQHLSELLDREVVLLSVLFPSMHDPQDIERIWLLGQPLTERGGKIYYLKSLDIGKSPARLLGETVLTEQH